ncbi:MAG: hypothetical protein KF819_32510 [Labilithrix sp.]|nr:hypothetical protein [Labilithrix sp.]
MRALFALALLVCAACSSTATGSGGPLGTSSDPEKACLDTIEALARAGERCGANYQTTYDAALKNATGGSCANVLQIRDETLLRGTCLPSLQTMSCADLNAGKLDEACAQQLLRRSP